MSFVPIKLGDYVRLFPKSNRGRERERVSARLRKALEAYQAGERCDCGEPIWVVGSAEAGHSCFTCITGEADPSEDYEIAEACYKASVPSRGGRRHGRAYQQHVSTPGNAARPPLPASPRRPRHPQIPPSTKASPTTTCRSKIAYALEHGQETAAAYLPAGEEAVPPTGGFAAGFVVRIELSSIRRPHEAGYLLPPLSSDDPCAAAATESTPGATRNET